MGSFRALHDLCRRTPKDDNRRNAGRVLVELIQCDGGEILDLSATGARFETRESWTVDQAKPITFTLESMDKELTIHSRCVRVKKSKRNKQLVGIVFDSITDEQRKLLTQIAMRAAKGTWGAPRRQANDVNWSTIDSPTSGDGSANSAA